MNTPEHETTISFEELEEMVGQQMRENSDPAPKAKLSIGQRFERFIWGQCRVCRMGRACLAVGAILFPLINIALLLYLILRGG